MTDVAVRRIGRLLEPSLIGASLSISQSEAESQRFKLGVWLNENEESCFSWQSSSQRKLVEETRDDDDEVVDEYAELLVPFEKIISIVKDLQLIIISFTINFDQI